MRHPSDEDLAEVRAALVARIREGLEADGRQIKALDAHVGPPARDLSGQALVVDIGGTNMRAATVELADGGATIVGGPISKRLDLRESPASREEFFDAQAALARELGGASGLPVGYCFSYPSEVLPSLDARLIRWTKGIDVPGVEGTLVGTGLREALVRAELAPGEVHVLNDTIASMLGGAYASDSAGDEVIGLIAGTGSNLAGFFEASAHEKLRGGGRSGPVAINLESGNFEPPGLTSADDAVDRESNNPGAQRFEKAVAGFYLPFLYAQLKPEAGLDPELGSGELVRRRDEEGDETAGVLLARSAAYVAVAITAVADVQAHDEVAVLAEGSLFWRDPKFRPAVEAGLARLAPNRRVDIRRLEHANLIGSACAALSSSR